MELNKTAQSPFGVGSVSINNGEFRSWRDLAESGLTDWMTRVAEPYIRF